MPLVEWTADYRINIQSTHAPHQQAAGKATAPSELPQPVTAQGSTEKALQEPLPSGAAEKTFMKTQGDPGFLSHEAANGKLPEKTFHYIV